MVNVSLFILFQRLKLEVLGTEFNVKTNRQGASTTLVSRGELSLLAERLIKKERAVLIQPGQKISYDAKTGKI